MTLNVEYFFLLVGAIAGLASSIINFTYFFRNHSVKKWLRLFSAFITFYVGLVFFLAHIHILDSSVFGPLYVRPIMFILVLFPAFDAIVDWDTVPMERIKND